MSDNFTYAGGSNAYVPQLHAEIMKEFVRSPAKFPLNKYINVRHVDKMVGYWVSMKNDSQNRIVLGPQDYAYPDGADAPQLLYGGESHEFKAFNCKRYLYPRRYGELAVAQAAWDLKAQAARSAAMQGMTARCLRVHQTLTTSGNYLSGHTLNSSATAAGVTWGNATSALPAIRQSVMQMALKIQTDTLGTVQFQDLYLVMNPNTAKVVATSQEFIDYLKQNPTSLELWQGDEQYLAYNIPTKLFGLNVVVDNTVYNNQPAGTSTNPNNAFTFPDNKAVLVTKQAAITPAAGSAFASFEIFSYQEFETLEFFIPHEHRYLLQVIENVDDSFFLAPESAAMINTNS